MKCKKEAAIRPDLQVRQRQGQQVQQHKEPTTGHVTTGTSDQATCSTGKLVACPVDKVQAGSGGNLLLPRRRLPRQSDGLCKHYTVPHTLCTRNTFSRVARD